MNALSAWEARTPNTGHTILSKSADLKTQHRLPPSSPSLLRIVFSCCESSASGQAGKYDTGPAEFQLQRFSVPDHLHYHQGAHCLYWCLIRNPYAAFAGLFIKWSIYCPLIFLPFSLFISVSVKLMCFWNKYQFSPNSHWFIYQNSSTEINEQKGQAKPYSFLLKDCSTSVWAPQLTSMWLESGEGN